LNIFTHILNLKMIITASVYTINESCHSPNACRAQAEVNGGMDVDEAA